MYMHAKMHVFKIKKKKKKKPELSKKKKKKKKNSTKKCLFEIFCSIV